jgi:hypothetical protein
VTIASRAEHLGVDPFSIVADEDPEAVRLAFDSDLDARRPRVPEGVDQRLASDAVHLVADHRVQALGVALADDPQVDLVLDPQLVADARKGPPG